MFKRLFESQQMAINAGGTLVALVILTVLAYLVYALVNFEVPVANRDAMMLVAGGVLTQTSQIVGWFFGSSLTNKRQADTIEHLSKAAVPQAPVIDATQGATITTVTATDTKVEPPDGVKP